RQSGSQTRPADPRRRTKVPFKIVSGGAPEPRGLSGAPPGLGAPTLAAGHREAEHDTQEGMMTTMTPRPPLTRLGLDTGKKARLHRILHQHGLRNGTALFLPYDQGLEHGPRDFFANPVSGDPRYILRLAVEGGFNGIAVQIGLAEKF